MALLLHEIENIHNVANLLEEFLRFLNLCKGVQNMMSDDKTPNEPSGDGSFLMLPLTREGSRRRRSISLDNSDLDTSVKEAGLVALNDTDYEGDANLRVEMMSPEHQR